jgi:ABC-2 type transport system ATP-binding protein
MIRTENLQKRFGTHEALRGVNLNVPEGSAYALLGANGAGKTTTLRILMNILQAERGTATILGVDSRRLSPRELAQIGYVSENQSFPKSLTVAEYLSYLGPFYARWDKGLEASIQRRFELPSGGKIGSLSHGTRMKFALTCALPFRPKLLVLDEPLSGLDALVRDEFMATLLETAGETTVLISSHELNEIEGVATDVGFLDHGKLLFEESHSALADRFREVRVVLDREAQAPRRAPKEWLNIETAGNVVMFIDSKFSEEELSAATGALAGSVRHIDVQPMSLRAIFKALALATKTSEQSR